MLKYSILALLLVVSLQQSLYLSPLYPPTAFEGQYYEVRFRVRGLDYPQFTFKGLPECFKASSDGVITGIPRGAGSYAVLVAYTNGKDRDQKEVIIRITPSFQSDSTFESAVITQSVKTAGGIIINYPATLVYQVGTVIQFQLEAKNGNAPLLWRYNSLPSGIYGDQTGLVKGTFINTGYYSFSASCADSLGVSAEAYITWNIQPRTLIRSSQLVEVQSQHVELQYDIYQVEKEQVTADEELFKALEIVDQKKKVAAAKKQVVAVNTVKVNNAQASYDAANKAYAIAVSDRDNAQDSFRLAENGLKATQQNLALAQTEQTNAQQNLINARNAVSEAQKRFAQTQIDLTAAEDRLVDAQDKMRNAEEKLRTTKTVRDAAQNEYKRSFADLEDAKGDLEAAKRRKELTDISVVNAKDSLLLVQQARDDANSMLNKADFVLKNAEANLNRVLDKLAAIRSLYVTAKTELGQAQWNFETALNKLYISQARKETADRASAIALAEGSNSDHNSGYQTTSVGQQTSPVTVGAFIGCDAQVYPPISGTVKITQKLVGGYVISTGHQVVYGACTKQTACNVGDTVAYSGFLVNGVVNAQRIERVLLS